MNSSAGLAIQAAWKAIGSHAPASPPPPPPPPPSLLPSALLSASAPPISSTSPLPPPPPTSRVSLQPQKDYVCWIQASTRSPVVEALAEMEVEA
ncbi:MAG: hypothetical protein M1813_007919 [Trichoglossum hirsutum]|nr:MAG: hypothetical protein M1813_007919 [Trichoglossum hirsutum]